MLNLCIIIHKTISRQSECLLHFFITFTSLLNKINILQMANCRNTVGQKAVCAISPREESFFFLVFFFIACVVLVSLSYLQCITQSFIFLSLSLVCRSVIRLTLCSFFSFSFLSFSHCASKQLQFGSHSFSHFH